MAERLPAIKAVLAVPARRVEPGHANAISQLKVGDIRPYRHHLADPFMTGNKRRYRFDGPVALRRMEIGMADAGRRNFHQHLPCANFWYGYLLNNQRCTKRLNHGSFHHFHDFFLLLRVSSRELHTFAGKHIDLTQREGETNGAREAVSKACSSLAAARFKRINRGSS